MLVHRPLRCLPASGRAAWLVHNPGAIPKPGAGACSVKAARNESQVRKGPDGFNGKTPVPSSVAQVSRSAPHRGARARGTRPCIAAGLGQGMSSCTQAPGESCAVFWEGVLLPQSLHGGDGACGHCRPWYGAFTGPGRLGITAAPGTWVLGERCRGCPHEVLLAGCLAPAGPSRGVPGRGGSIAPGVCDSPEAKPPGQAAPRGGGRDGRIDSTGDGQMAGWRSRCVRGMDGWRD